MVQTEREGSLIGPLPLALAGPKRDFRVSKISWPVAYP